MAGTAKTAENTRLVLKRGNSMAVKKVGMVVGAAVLSIGIIGVSVLQVLHADRKGPVISIEASSTLIYQEGMDEKQLLEGVKAVDEKDGDVSDTLMVENVRIDSSGTFAEVTYVALDSHNNVTKVNRKLPTASGSETSEVPMIPSEETSGEGSLGEPDEIPEGEAGITADSAGEPGADTEPLPEGSPHISLNAHEVTIAKGDSFKALNYVENITDDKDARNSLYRDIQVSGSVDTKNAGVYELSYYVVDNDGNESNKEILRVTVQ